MKPFFQLTSPGHSEATGSRSLLLADVAQGQPCQQVLARALVQVQQAATATDQIRIDLPPGKETRIRNLVHRGAVRPVFKTTSVKLERVVQCESALEHEASLLLDAAPAVRAYAEQPVRIHYEIHGAWRSHVPDFVALVEHTLTFIEARFEMDVDSEVLFRTALLQQQLALLGARYALVTEREVRREHQVQNARRILRRARHVPSEFRLIGALEKLRAAAMLPLSTFGWCVADSQDAACVARLMMTGLADYHSGQLLSERSWVRARETELSMAGAP